MGVVPSTLQVVSFVGPQMEKNHWWICHRCFGLTGDFCADDEFTNKVIFEKGFEVRFSLGVLCVVRFPPVGEKNVFFNVRTQKSTTKKNVFDFFHSNSFGAEET